MKLAFLTFFIITALSCANNNFAHKKIDVIKTINDNKSLLKIDSCTSKKQHYFDSKISFCFRGLINKMQTEPQTYFCYRDGLCVCIIEEIILGESFSSDSIYKTLYSEAENVRKGPKYKFGEICLELRQEQFFYVLKKENSIYLFSDGNSYNYPYQGKYDSNDAIIRRDQEDKNNIVFDDIYRLLEIY